MREPDILCTSMTKLETMLKAYFLQRPELQNRIITSTELSNYISWMASRHNSGFVDRFTAKDIPDFTTKSLYSKNQRHQAFAQCPFDTK